MLNSLRSVLASLVRDSYHFNLHRHTVFRWWELSAVLLHTCGHSHLIISLHCLHIEGCMSGETLDRKVIFPRSSMGELWIKHECHVRWWQEQMSKKQKLFFLCLVAGVLQAAGEAILTHPLLLFRWMYVFLFIYTWKTGVQKRNGDKWTYVSDRGFYRCLVITFQYCQFI